MVAVEAPASARADTSAVTAFGAGGMVHGPITADSLVTAGDGGSGFGLVNAGIPSAAMESVVMSRLPAVIVQRGRELAQDPAIWRLFVQTQRQVRRSYVGLVRRRQAP